MQISTTSTNEIPSFTVYPISKDFKTCYQSQRYKIICFIKGPYYDRKNKQLAPIINVSIVDSSDHGEIVIPPEMITSLEMQVVQVMDSMIVQDRYARMSFDIAFDVIQCCQLNPFQFILSPVINLLAYTAAVKGLEIKSLFACSCVCLLEEKLYLEMPASLIDCKSQRKTMILAFEARDNRSVLLQFEGGLTYVHYERMVGLIMDSNLQIVGFLQNKVSEIIGGKSEV